MKVIKEGKNLEEIKREEYLINRRYIICDRCNAEIEFSITTDIKGACPYITCPHCTNNIHIINKITHKPKGETNTMTQKTDYHIYLNDKHIGTIYDITTVEKDPYEERLFFYNNSSIFNKLLQSKNLTAIIKGKEDNTETITNVLRKSKRINITTTTENEGEI